MLPCLFVFLFCFFFIETDKLLDKGRRPPSKKPNPAPIPTLNLSVPSKKQHQRAMLSRCGGDADVGADPAVHPMVPQSCNPSIIWFCGCCHTATRPPPGWRKCRPPSAAPARSSCGSPWWPPAHCCHPSSLVSSFCVFRNPP